MSFLSSNCNNPNNLPGYELNTYTDYNYPISTRFPLFTGGSRKTKKQILKKKRNNKKSKKRVSSKKIKKRVSSKKIKKRVSSKKIKKRVSSKKFKTKKHKIQKGGFINPLDVVKSGYNTLSGNDIPPSSNVLNDQMTHN